MNGYMPHTQKEQDAMLEPLGFTTTDELFLDIPEGLRLSAPLHLPKPLCEYDLVKHMTKLAGQNISADTHACFLGGGIYDHFIPAAIGQVSGRQEFYTAYTPYQAEVSQGTLQAIFEYQSLICALTGMDVSNASVYDAATACAEAMLMSCHITGRSSVVLCGGINPQYATVCQTYARYRQINMTTIPFDSSSGSTCLQALEAAVTKDSAAVLVQSPNFFGCVEDLAAIGQIAKASGALFITCVDPISLGLLKPPAAYGADIVVGEGQALGNPMYFGGPGFGFLACKAKHMRKLPGRIVGETTDADGNRGFVLTIQAREQHIRREKALSNICSNQSLCALNAAVYLSLMGKSGLQQVAQGCLQKSHYLYNRLLETGKFEPTFTGSFFKEFTLTYTGGSQDGFSSAMLHAGFMPGLWLTQIPGLSRCLLVAVTEKRSKQEMDAYAEKVGELD